jgi:uncharacterized protein (TIGR02300 family)
MDKAKLGTKYSCFKCGCGFYDLRRAKPTCPKCGANQTEAPKQGNPPLGRASRTAASTRPKPRKRREEVFEPEQELLDQEEPDEDQGEDLSLVEDDDLLDIGDDDFQDDT